MGNDITEILMGRCTIFIAIAINPIFNHHGRPFAPCWRKHFWLEMRSIDPLVVLWYEHHPDPNCTGSFNMQYKYNEQTSGGVRDMQAWNQWKKYAHIYLPTPSLRTGYCITDIKTSKPWQNGSHFADDIFKRIVLTHWDRDEIYNISQTIFSNVFTSMKMFEFRLKFHWSLFPRVQLTIFQHWFR